MSVEGADVVVIGGSQAGLATGHELARAGIDHVILERDRVASSWRGLWDGFCINTPNWSLMLPGHAYDGDDPDGFLTREGIVGYLERYASAADGSVREGVDVTSLRPVDGGFRLDTTDGPMDARTVVVCTGAYQRAFRPAGAAALPPSSSPSTPATIATPPRCRRAPSSSSGTASRDARSPRSLWTPGVR